VVVVVVPVVVAMVVAMVVVVVTMVVVVMRELLDFETKDFLQTLKALGELLEVVAVVVMMVVVVVVVMVLVAVVAVEVVFEFLDEELIGLHLEHVQMFLGQLVRELNLLKLVLQVLEVVMAVVVMTVVVMTVVMMTVVMAMVMGVIVTDFDVGKVTNRFIANRSDVIVQFNTMGGGLNEGGSKTEDGNRDDSGLHFVRRM